MKTESQTNGSENRPEIHIQSENPPPEIRVVPDVHVTDNDGVRIPDSDVEHDAAERSTVLGSVSHFTGSDEEDEDEHPHFRRFTPRSYRKLLRRSAAEKKKADEQKNRISEGRLVDGELKFDDGEDGEEKLERDPALHEGGSLPGYLADEFPPELFKQPLEEIDPAISDKTFVVITKRLKKKYIYRFSATKSLFMFAPWNPWRRFMITISTNQFFDYFIIATILVNMAFLALHQPYQWLTTAEYVFTAIYTVEMLIKITSRGFVIYKYTYLRDPWNWIDFIVIIAAYVTVIVEQLQAGNSEQLGSLSALKTLRVFRAFKTVSVMPGLKVIISALLRSMKMLVEVVILKLFCMMVFALFALQVYVGVLRQKCVLNLEPNLVVSDAYYMEYVKNDSHWYVDGGDYVICGNASGAGKCPANYTCLSGVGENPNWGYTTFDNFGWALLNAFQLITLDYWEDLYDKVIRASGPWNIIFFIMVVFFGSFYLVNMMLAVVNMAYEEEVSQSKQEKERDKLDEKLKKKNKKSKTTKNSEGKDGKKDTNHLQVMRAVNGSHTASSASLKSVGNGVLHSSSSSISDGTQNNNGLRDQAAIVENSKQGNGKKKADSKKTTKDTSGDKDKPNGSKTKTKVKITKKKNPKIVEGVDNPAMIDDDGSIQSEDNDGDPPVIVIRGKSWGDSSDSGSDEDDDELVHRNCECCARSACNYIQWLRFQNALNKVISDFGFEMFITLCIALNVIFMAIEYHGMPDALTTFLKIANYVFTAIFTLECVLKHLALSKFYYKSNWNIFDLIIVIASLVDLGLEDINGLSAFRAFRLLRLLRVFKLAQSWSTMRMLLSIILRALGSLANLTFVLFIVGYIFAIIGMQLFGASYTEAVFYPDPIPRWNFKDFFHAIVLIFRILCGEWIEPLWDCMRAEGELCMVVFLPTLVFGNLMVLNLFLALLLNAFANDSLGSMKESSSDAKEDSKMKKGWNRIKNLFKRKNKVKQEEEELQKSMVSIVSEMIKHERESDAEGDPHANSNGTSRNRKTNKSMDANFQTDRNKYNTFDGAIGKSKSENNAKKDKKAKEEEEEEMKKSKSNLGDEDENGDKPGEISDFWCKKCYTACGCCMMCIESIHGQRWTTMRQGVHKVTEHKAFEWFILFIIMASSISLCFEDIYLPQKPTMELVLEYLNMVYFAVFLVEMVLKMIALGWKKYFTNFWTILDFCIVVISGISLAADSLGLSQIASFRSLRTLRALRPLRAVSRWQGMKIVVNALVHAIPAIFNVLLVCLVFWLIFSIAGVQLFGGKFYKCIDKDKVRIDSSIVPNRSVCEELQNSGMYVNWTNSLVHFDNVGSGYLALLQIATFEGWIEVMKDGVDATEVDEQPRDEANFASYIFFIIFIIFGSFFTLNLFIGVIIDNFNRLKKKYEGGYIDVLLTQNQRNYYNTMKKLGNRKPQKTIKRPKNKVQGFFFDVSVSTKFELAIVILIFFNMISMGVEHYNQSDAYSDALDIMNIIFTTIFTLEAMVKIIGMRWHYFRRTWNVFDFLIVILSVIGVVLDDILRDVFVTPSLLRVVRVFRIGRVLRLIKVAKGIRKLLFALMISLPALFNIAMLLFLIILMYAIFGMAWFGNVKPTGAMNDVVNFQTFGNSFLLLFRLTTAGGWNEILEPLRISYPDCDPDNMYYFDGTSRAVSGGNCGRPNEAFFFMVTFIMLTYLVIINMYIAVILENFSQAHEQEEVGITEDDFEMFYVIWERYDPHATQFIKYDHLSDLVSDLDQPLGMPKPNEIAIVAFDLPIYDGDRLHCLDILTALVKHVLGSVEVTEEFKNLKGQIEEKYREAFPTRVQQNILSSTMRRKKEDVAAKTLQRAWRKHKVASSLRKITEMAMQMKRQQTQDNMALGAAGTSGTKAGNRPSSPKTNSKVKAANKAAQVRKKSSLGRRLLVPTANDISLPSDNDVHM